MAFNIVDRSSSANYLEWSPRFARDVLWYYAEILSDRHAVIQLAKAFEAFGDAQKILDHYLENHSEVRGNEKGPISATWGRASGSIIEQSLKPSESYVIKCLVAMNAELNKPTEPSLNCVLRKKPGISLVKELLANKANVNIENPDTKCKPIGLAIYYCPFAMVQFLILNNAEVDVHEKDSEGHTLLFYPCLLNECPDRSEKIKLLVLNGAEVDATDSEGATALHYVVSNVLYSCVNTLVQEKAQVNARDYLGLTALHKAARCGNHFMVAELLGYDGIDKAPKNNNGYTPSNLAHSARFKLQSNTDEDERDDNYFSKLNLYREIIKLLPAEHVHDVDAK